MNTISPKSESDPGSQRTSGAPIPEQAHPLPKTRLPVLKQTAEVFYQCPDEDFPISKAIHLSRLAAFNPICRECPHRNETGNLSPQTIKRLQQIQIKRGSAQSLFTREGIRGVYLNEINRTQAAEIAGAFSSLLWESLPLKGKAPLEQVAHSSKLKNYTPEISRAEPSRGPSVVIGFDERPFSPDIITGVASALRRNGCRVIDLGPTVPAMMSFAMTHLQAQGAIMVTGAQCGPSHTGFEFLRENAQPVSTGHGLENIQEIFRIGFGRASRQPGSQRTFHPLESYRAQFSKHFHALRPLKIAIACPLRLVRETLNSLFEKLPCQLSWVDVPHQKRDLLNASDPDVLKMCHQLHSGGFDLGVMIDDDGRRCAFFDEAGVLQPHLLISGFIMQALAHEHTDKVFILEAENQECVTDIPSGWKIHNHNGTLADTYLQMQKQRAVYAGSLTGYHWFRETVPTCDAILTLAHVLAALSFSDAPFSEVLSQ